MTRRLSYAAVARNDPNPDEIVYDPVVNVVDVSIDSAVGTITSVSDDISESDSLPSFASTSSMASVTSNTEGKMTLDWRSYKTPITVRNLHMVY